MARREPLDRIPLPLGFFREFARLQASGSILLLGATIVAFVWANSPWWEAYDALWEIDFGVGAEGRGISLSFLYVINDGLMAIFFFVVGLEIKRELIAGELASVRRAALPMAAAVGGMVVPAGLYAVFNAGGEAAAGWGIPMATDIAFALAVLAALGPRVPGALKVFLTALAIVDDLGAILVIAFFYSHGVAWGWLAVAGAMLGVLVALNLLHVRKPILYALPGIVVWAAFLQSGIHATVAGVLVALTIPASRRILAREFLDRARAELAEFEEATEFRASRIMSSRQQEAVHELEQACEHVSTPLTRMEHGLHPYVTYLILPLFALANAGVRVVGGETTVWAGPLTLGIVLGLVAGKPLGITLFAWLAVRLGLAELPADVDWREVWGTAWLGGIGFTMSLFIANLAFDGALLESAKLAVLAASVLAAAGGWFTLVRVAGTRIHPAPGEESAPART
ncbi:MAG TPA: Na+/H+ antiporter NhaA [Gemmatimonadota bacterium]|nr:Na+/H+ antiporter NhaA [Gemmatimonadota bacterium]